MVKIKYIIASARTGSEWDNVNVGLVEIRTALLDNLKRLINRAKELKAEGIDAITVYSDNAEYFNVDEDEIEFEIPKEDEVNVIEFTMKQFNKLARPEQDIRYGSMVITENDVTFKAFGKHTDEEFWFKVSNEFILNL